MGNIRQYEGLDRNVVRISATTMNFRLSCSKAETFFHRTTVPKLVGKTGVYRGIPSPCLFAALHNSSSPFKGFGILFQLLPGVSKQWVRKC